MTSDSLRLTAFNDPEYRIVVRHLNGTFVLFEVIAVEDRTQDLPYFLPVSDSDESKTSFDDPTRVEESTGSANSTTLRDPKPPLRATKRSKYIEFSAWCSEQQFGSKEESAVQMRSHRNAEFGTSSAILMGVSDGHFIRFVVNEAHPTVDAELGMFTALESIDFSAQKRSLQRAYEEVWYWFSTDGGGGLYRPRLTGKLRNHAIRKSLFWFKSDAGFSWSDRGAVVRRARQLAQVMIEAGVEVRELHTDEPGHVIWEDLKQVLTRPTDTVPRAFETQDSR